MFHILHRGQNTWIKSEFLNEVEKIYKNPKYFLLFRSNNIQDRGRIVKFILLLRFLKKISLRCINSFLLQIVTYHFPDAFSMVQWNWDHKYTLCPRCKIWKISVTSCVQCILSWGGGISWAKGPVTLQESSYYFVLLT